MECTDHVVVGVDGSPASIAAAVWAQEIARAGDWPLTILHTPHLATDIRTLRADSGQLVAAPGMLAPALAEASRTAAMVVIPARGADAPIVPVMDAVAEDLLQEAHGPVVVIPATTWNTFDRPVVLGLDLEEPGVPGIRFAAAVARRAGMPLKVVVADERCEDIDELRNRAVAILTEAGAELLPASYDVMISPHEPADALLAEALEASLTVVGSRGPNYRGQRENSESRRLLRLTSTPVAVVADHDPTP